MNEPHTGASPGASKHFRQLKSHELVWRGDFVANVSKDLELLEGPNGFQADSFNVPIYWRDEGHSAPVIKMSRTGA
jgi:hypothetical protein